MNHMTQLDCENLIKEFLLNKNPFYQYRLPISILVSVLVFTSVINTKKIKNSYLLQIIIPLGVLVLVYLFINLISNLLISKNELIKMRHICKNWFGSMSIRNHPILSKITDLDIIESYSSQTNTTSLEMLKKTLIPMEEERRPFIKESFSNIENNTKEETESFINSSEYLPVDKEVTVPSSNKCLLSSSCGALCSGEGKPDNLVAPIPGPQWQPQSAAAVQQRLANKDYTKAYCNF